MPYVTKETREYLQPLSHEMLKFMLELQEPGILNYILFNHCVHFVNPSYTNYKNFIGELNECVAEIRRRLLAPYEDKKIEENGDI